MNRQDDTRLQNATQSLRDAAPNDAQLAASGRHLASRLGLDGEGEVAIDAIEGCDDIQRLRNPYRAGTLSNARSLLIEAHLRDCSSCRRQFVSGSGASAVDWSRPEASRPFSLSPRVLGWALACSFVVLASSFFLYKAFWQVPPGVRAQVQSIDGAAYLVSETGDRQLAPGDQLTEGQRLRTSGGAHAVLRLSDGSTMEVNERSVLGIGARGNNMTVTLDDGAVIVQAAKRNLGHLYLKTPDCRVAVTGTVFTVSSGIKGSRVAVLQGSVHVEHAGIDSLVNAGDQTTTSDNLTSAPVSQQIAWSQDRDKYLPLLAQFSALQHRIELIPFPQLRYNSDLLARVPADTQLYISIPNLGEFLSEANETFHDQLKQSPALQQWWNNGHGQNTEQLDALVDKLHQMSQYLGDEIVIVGVKQTANPGFAIIADVKQGGLDSFLKTQFAASGSHPPMTVLDPGSLNAAHDTSKDSFGGYALIGAHEAVFSNSIATLKQVNAQLNSGASGFATGEFGKQITAAYSRGAGIILAANLQAMVNRHAAQIQANSKGNEAFKKSGIQDIRYLIAEHREVNGKPENRMHLQFAGVRQGVASWLAAPAPMNSLNFITPNAAVALAVLSKDPKAIADDLLAMAIPNQKSQTSGWSEVEEKLQINLRDDLAGNLGGEFLVSLDGPVLPTPSWKAVIEVRDPEQLEKTLEQLTEAIRNQTKGSGGHSIQIESSKASGQTYYSIRDTKSGTVVAEYTYANGYMVLAPNRAIVMAALQTYESGDSLAHSTAFRALLPKDEDENYSAIAYQNLSPVLTPLLAQFSGQSADALRSLASDARPTAICARGEESSIVAASDSHLFGFDFLTLGTLIDSGNKHPGASVQQ
jgi:hypothetical protein